MDSVKKQQAELYVKRLKMDSLIVDRTNQEINTLSNETPHGENYFYLRKLIVKFINDSQSNIQDISNY